MGHGMRNTDKMVSGRSKPVWHQNLGTNVEHREGLLTCEEARNIAFPWEPIFNNLYTEVGDGALLRVPDNRMVVRNDLATNDPNRFLGIIGTKYTLIPNQEIVDIGNAITSYGSHCDTAGSLHGGRRVYMSMLLPGTANVKDDTIAQYLIITTSHDGTSAFQFLLAPVRVVCQNTLSAAIGSKSCSFGIRHTEHYQDRVKVALVAMKKATDYFEDHTKILRNLADIRLSKAQARKYFERVMGVKKDKDKKDSTHATNVVNRLEELFHGKQDGADQDAVKNTMYGAVNAVTQWIERERTTRVHGKSETDTAMNERIERDNRIEAVLFGTGADLRDKAMDLAVAALN